MPVIVATITPKPGKADEIAEFIARIIPQVHDEDGCELYALHKGNDRLVFIEKWRDMAALGVHGGAPSLKALNDGLKGLVAGPLDVQVLEALPAGDPAKGAL